MKRPGGEQRIPRPTNWRPGEPAPWHGATTRLDAASVAQTLLVLDRPVDAVPTFPGARLSAVLIVLRDGVDGAEVLLTRRSMSLRHHKGEISFPGGRVDPGEEPDDAARREAFEEVAMPLDAVEIVGHLQPISTVVSLSLIVPVVGVLHSDPVLVPAEAEVDRILWVSLADLVSEHTYREEWWGEPPLDRSIHFFELDDETIWGATARLLHQLLVVAHQLGG
ncbi:MAG: CoA pyrophosphatase [Ilumatobacteraceae bacterium]